MKRYVMIHHRVSLLGKAHESAQPVRDRPTSGAYGRLMLIRDFVRMWHGVNVASRGPRCRAASSLTQSANGDAFRRNKIESVHRPGTRRGNQPVTG